jgi:hypothetical protein
MTLCKRMVIGGCAVVAMVSAATAQITLTKDDLLNRFEVGKSISIRMDGATKTLDIGSPGASSYDFSGLLSHSSTPLTSVDPATTPYSSEFPQATHVVQTYRTIIAIRAMAYVYFKLGDSLRTLALKGGVPPLPNPNVQGTINYTPADVYFKTPCTLGTQWTSAFRESTSYVLFGSPGALTPVDHNATYVADGYGPMTLPGGAVQQALRIRKIDRRSTGATLSYLFISKGFALVQVVAADTMQPTSGKIAISPADSIEWNAAVPTGVEVSDVGMPEGFLLEQNYPNPFNPSTVVRFSVPAASRVKLAVYDLLGREVALLVDGETPAGIHSAEFSAAGLPSGVYIARMQAAGFSASRTMVLMK